MCDKCSTISHVRRSDEFTFGAANTAAEHARQPDGILPRIEPEPQQSPRCLPVDKGAAGRDPPREDVPVLRPGRRGKTGRLGQRVERQQRPDPEAAQLSSALLRIRIQLHLGITIKHWRQWSAEDVRINDNLASCVLQISIHGFLGFSDSMESLPLPPLQFPVQTWPKDKDPSFIGPFYSRCRIGRFKESDADKRLPGVYFRYLKPT